ncbi:MAG TPA: copper-binding protein [Lysobacter sp.]
MKIAIALLPLVLLAGCSAPDSTAPTTDATPAPAATEPAPAAPAAPAPVAESPAAATGSATGVVESVDAAAKTVTIAHEAVESLKWPAMTMTFQAPDIDLSTIKAGDKVSFEVTAVGMDGTITSITRQ